MPISVGGGERVLRALFWLAIAFEILTLGGAGLAKFGSDRWPELFVTFGYPAWGVFAVGGLEIAGTLGLLIPRLRDTCAVVLIVIMIGAAITVLFNDTDLGTVQPLMHIVVLSFVLWSSRRATRNAATEPDGSGVD